MAVFVNGSGVERRFSPLFGRDAVIGLESNKVIDVTVKGLHCGFCAKWELEEADSEFDDLPEEHAHQCRINHEGSSCWLEAHGTVEPSQRSFDGKGVICKHFIGDADAKSYKAVED